MPRRVLWALLLFLLPLTARAWPVDVVLDVEKGSEKFQRLASLDWFEVEDPSIAQVEWLESGELLVTGKAAGRTLVLLYSQGQAAVWRIRVNEKGAAAKQVNVVSASEAARKACPGLKVESTLEGAVKTEACRAALLALLETDTYRIADLDLTFEGTVLQAQLQAIQIGLTKAGIKASAKYVGAGLVLDGTLTLAERKRAYWEIFKRSTGGLAVEERAPSE